MLQILSKLLRHGKVETHGGEALRGVILRVQCWIGSGERRIAAEACAVIKESLNLIQRKEIIFLLNENIYSYNLFRGLI
jgi:hypothetical protein